MGNEEIESYWSNLTSKLCDSCKSETALLFCRADSAYLCMNCDSDIHSANKLASRHERVWMCEVCESEPASVTCKADAASLCITCDSDIHSANPLAHRHERFPVIPFYESAISASVNKKPNNINLLVVPNNFIKNDNEEEEEEIDEVHEDDETEAASWLLQNPNPNKLLMEAPDLMIMKSGGGGIGEDYIFSDVDPYLDLDYSEISDHKFKNHDYQNGFGSDSVVPVQTLPIPNPLFNSSSEQNHCMDYDFSRSKPSYSYNTQSLSRSVSSSSMDVGVVPDANCNSMADISNPFVRNLKNGMIIDNLNNSVVSNGITDTITTTTTNGNQNQVVSQLTGLDREARVLRYREKRKNRKFEKTIRYASRKAYAETRPRIKGRFAKRTEIEPDLHRIYSSSTPASFMVDSGYGIVPSF